MGVRRGALPGATEDDLRVALGAVLPALADLPMTVLASMSVRAEWCRSTAIIDGRFAVKFAWTQEAADVLSREAQIQQALANTDVATADLVVWSEEPTLIVCELASGRPLTYEAAGRLSHDQTRAVAAAMVVELVAFHGVAVADELARAGIALGTARAQSTTDELRDRLPVLLSAPTWRRIERVLSGVDAVLAEPEPQVVVHGDWHGHNLVFNQAFDRIIAVLDFAETGIGDAAFDLRYLPRQSPTLDLLDAAIDAYRAATGHQVSRDRVLAWHVLTDLGDALWRTDTHVEVVAGPIERRAIDLVDVLRGSALLT